MNPPTSVAPESSSLSTAPTSTVPTSDSSAPSTLSTSGSAAVPSVVQSAVAQTHVATSVSATLGATPRAGNVLVAGVGYDDGSEASATAPSGWTHINTVASGTTGVSVSTFYHAAGTNEGRSFAFSVRSPHGGISINVKLFEAAGINPAAPLRGSWTNIASGGLSSSPPAIQPAIDGLLPLVFLAQTVSAEPQIYNSTAGWSDAYQALFGNSYHSAFEAHAGPPTKGTASVAFTQTWRAVNAGSKVAQLVMLNPGAGSATPSPAPTGAPPPPPAGVSTTHVPNLAYYQGLFLNTRISASWFAQHFTMTQQGSDGSYATRFLAAGGKFAMTYSDPTMVATCTWPAPYRCPGALSTSSGLPLESSWLHDSSGRRLHVTAYGSQPNGKWQERVNPADAAVQAAYAAQTAGWPGNAIFADDTSASVDPTPPGTSDYDMYKYGALPHEYCKGSEAQCEAPSAQFIASFGALLNRSAHPVFTNGGPQAENLTLMRANPHVIGNGLENCLVPGLSDAKWQATQNFILQVTALHRYSLCFSKYHNNQAAERAYYLASYWMVYDGTYAAIWEDMKMSHGDTGIMPEYGVVPGTPTVNRSSMANLQRSSGVYVREFTNCAENGAVFGRCVAIVNNTGSSVARPSLSASYSQTMSFASTTSWYDGGSGQWTAGTPSTIPPHSGVILR